jgi:hypothetical protein
MKRLVLSQGCPGEWKILFCYFTGTLPWRPVHRPRLLVHANMTSPIDHSPADEEDGHKHRVHGNLILLDDESIPVRGMKASESSISAGKRDSLPTASTSWFSVDALDHEYFGFPSPFRNIESGRVTVHCRLPHNLDATATMPNPR